MLEAAGKQIDPARIANDTMRAMTGRAAAKISRTAAQQTAGRMTRRWAKGVVPVVGIGYAGWDAQRTVAEIARMEI